jgi:predicted acetyltransferase
MSTRQKESAVDEAVVLDRATIGDAILLGNLLELYIHDMSELFPVRLGVDGRFGYDKLPLYWSEPDRRFPFLVRHEGRIAGLALVTRGSPASEDPETFDIAEFFIIRSERRSGVGRLAAFRIFDRFPGAWTVRVSEGNGSALSFWADVVGDYAKGMCAISSRPGSPHGWRVFSFDSRPNPTPDASFA